MQPLSLSRLTVVSSLGLGLAATLASLRERRSGLTRCAFETVALDTYVGQVPDAQLGAVRGDLAQFDCRNNRLAQLALEQDGFSQAVAAAAKRYGAARIGVFLGTSTSGILQTELAFRRRDPANGALPRDFHYATTQNTFSLADFVRRYLGLAGAAAVVSSACSSSAKVFGNAARMIAAGVCDAAVVGGADSLCLTTLYGFNSLGLVSNRPCRPFDSQRDGISIGEGAGFALVETANAARDGSAALLLGVGESCDAYHMSTPHPEGLGARLAMQRALHSAALTPADIDYINVHGTATKTNDAAEDRAVCDLFGVDTPCSSTKGATGHLLGAAGIVESIICALSVAQDFMPGSANTQRKDPDLKCRYLTDNQMARVDRALTNSFGFGGSNCSLVFAKAR